MKKILALLAVVLGVVSCQTEPEGLDVNVGGEQEVAICVSLPETTRANSAEGAFANVDFSGDKTIRYILKIYQKVGNEYKASTDRQVEYSDGTNVVFPVRLVPNRDYRFVVWADYVVSKDDRDLHYNTADLANITLNDTWVAMDETRDAFTGYFDTVDAGKQYTSTSSINITLTRPFAKLRVITTDMKELGFLGIEPHNAVVTYTTQFHESFNAFNGQYGAETVSKTHTGFEIKAYDDNVAKKSKVLFTDYFFADDSDVVKFVMNVNEANGTLIKSNTFNTDIAVQRNYLTTIQGNILTDGNNVKVTVDPVFENADNPTDEPYYHQTISSAAEFYAALNKAGEYTVISDIDITSSAIETRTTGAPAEGKVTTINLNGKTITVTNKTNAPFATVTAGNTLFLEGGNIVLAEGSTASFIKNDGNVVLTSGEINNNSTAAPVVDGTIIVDEGTVNDTKAESVVETENWLDHILANGGTYLFTEDMTASKIIEVTAENVVLDGNGFTLTSTATRAINVSGAKNVTIKNLNIVASGERAINVIQNAKNVTIENVTAKAANYTVNVAGSAPGAVVAIKNSTLNGLCTVNVSSVGTQVTVDGSTVNCNDNNTTEGEAYAALSLNKDAVGGSIIATNSTINVTEGSDSTAGRNGAEDGVVTIDGSVERVVVMVAAITYPGSDYYHAFQTIAAAVEFAKNGDVISPIRNVELTEPLTIAEGKNVVLDLNGKTITATNYAIENLGTLKINGNGTINGIVYCEATGNTTVENGTFNALESGKYVFLNSQGGTLTINGGTVNGGSSYPIYSYDEGSKLVINDVTVNATFGCVNAYGPEDGTKARAEVEINGGTFNMTGVKGKSSHIVYISRNTNATINGGTFEKIGDINMSGTGGGGICTYASTANLTINNGNFAGDYSDVYSWIGKISIKGGTYKHNPTTDYLAEGYKAIPVDGKYMVVAENVNGYVNSVITDKEAVRYVGDIFASGYAEGALWFNNYIFGGEAAIVVENTTYSNIIVENCSGDFKNDVITINNDNDSAMILQNLDFTLAEGAKLIKTKNTYYQVFMANITINGEKMTQETIGKYLENVGWYQVVEEI